MPLNHSQAVGIPPLTAKGSLRSSGAPTGVPLAGKKGEVEPLTYLPENGLEACIGMKY